MQGDGDTSRLGMLQTSFAELSDAELVLLTSEQGSIDGLRRLLAAKAPTDARLYNGLTPLMLAVLYDHTECVELLLDAGAEPNVADESGTTALHLAAVGGNEKMARQLCAVPGINLHAKLTTQDSETPVDLAQLVHPDWARQLQACIDEAQRA